MRLERKGPGRYRLDGDPVLSVTTVLSLAVPIPGLKWWAANMTAKEAVDNWEELSGLSITDRYERLRRAHESSFNRAGLRGTAIHKAAEGMVRGDEVSVPDEMVGPVRAIAKFLDDWGVHDIASEVAVAHTDWKLAGQADLYARVDRLGTEPVLLDYKTGKDVYDKDALQLCAYAHMNLWQPRPDVEESPPKVEQAFVVHVGPDSVRLREVDISDRVWDEFLYLATTARFLKALDDDGLVSEGELLAMRQPEVAS